MTNDKGIYIRNIFYMLAYAFQSLRQKQFEKIRSESFDGVEDLLAEILAQGMTQQIKQGLYKEYVLQNESLPGLRGKLTMPGTIRHRIAGRQLLSCEFDELSSDNIYNQILKTTAFHLIGCPAVNRERKRRLSQLIPYFDRISSISPTHIVWNQLHFQKNNRTYQFLIQLCRFIWDSLLQTTQEGSIRMLQFSDEHMERLYEKFILEYYRRHHPRLKASPAPVRWNLDDTESIASGALPAMKTDITLTDGDRILIIDAKYYGRSMQTSYYGKRTFHSSNLYQIYTYVKNKDTAHTGKVSGILLYARTSESIAPDAEFTVDGNHFAVKTLDLNTDFKSICAQLDELADSYFS